MGREGQLGEARTAAERFATLGISSAGSSRPLVVDLPAETEGARVGALWSEPLQRLAQALMRAASLADVAAAVVAYGTAAAGARWGHVMLLDHRGEAAVSLLGGSAVRSRRLDEPGPDVRLPWVDAARDGITRAFPSAEGLHRAYPDVARICEVPSEGAILTLPLRSAGEACGAVTFGFDGRGGVSRTTEAALGEIAALTTQAGRRAMLYDSELFSAETLQRAYLPEHPSDVAGLSFAARYLPAGESMAVGGDWYGVSAAPGRPVILWIGDAAGHGIECATVMASLRSALQAFTTVETSPAAILTRLNTYSCLFEPDAFATVMVAVFDPAGGRLRYASAGHPPALVCRAGEPRLLEEPVGPPLGLPGTTYADGEADLPPGGALVLYTDGLVERRERDLDATLAELVAAARQPGGTADELCDRLASGLLAGVEPFDDAALLVAVRDLEPGGPPTR